MVDTSLTYECEFAVGAGFLINPLLRNYKLIIDFLYLWDMKTNSGRLLMARLKVGSVSEEIYIILIAIILMSLNLIIYYFCTL